MDIMKLKSVEMEEVMEFYRHVEEFGHIFHHDPSVLDAPFKKILEGIEEVKQLMEDSYGL